MTESKHANEPFDTIARILLRCFVLGYALLLLWFAVYLCGGELLYGRLGGKLFGLTQHEVDAINYCGMAVVKGLVLLFFLIPYVAIRLVLRKST